MILLSDNIGPVQGVEHIMSVFPKIHCELNAIEQCWCHAKKYSRQYVNESIIRLRKVAKEIIRKFFDKCIVLPGINLVLFTLAYLTNG